MKRTAVLSGLFLLLGSLGWSGSAPRPAPVPASYNVEDGPPVDWSPEQAAFGERLFYDSILSGDRTVSCATRHDPAKASASTDTPVTRTGWPPSDRP